MVIIQIVIGDRNQTIASYIVSKLAHNDSLLMSRSKTSKSEQTSSLMNGHLYFMRAFVS